ncbi:hypothetical protein [Enterovirga sp.]|uniref:hypothetical protein n=1 Tax=Enterovirga sp. TaxID=2026350 RepID=UPI002B51B0AC|nr:hypothetical protein [Enterovirga sp.]HMO28560.1 hypothetical protein [Enterovirga sp.]
MIRPLAALLLLASPASLAQGKEHALVPEGADFCFRRSFGAACKPSKALWGRKGATPRLLGKLP